MTGDDEAVQIEIRIKRAEEYVAELERELSDSGDTATQRDEARDKMVAGLALMETAEAEQTRAFEELLAKHRRMKCELSEQRERLAAGRAQNESLRCRLGQLRELRDEQNATALRLNARRATLLDEAEPLRKRLADATAAAAGARDARRFAESELSARGDELARLRAAHADRTAEHARLDAALAVERCRAERLHASVGELREANEAAERAARTEMADARARDAEKAAEMAALRCRLDEQQAEATERTDAAAALKRDILKMRDAYYEDKGLADKEMAALRAEAQRTTAELAAAAERLCEARAEGVRLESRLRERSDAAEQCEAAREQLRREVAALRELADAAAAAMRAATEQHERDAKAAERKLARMAKEECRLRRQTGGQQPDQTNRSKREASDATGPTPGCGGDDDDDDHRDRCGLPTKRGGASPTKREGASLTTCGGAPPTTCGTAPPTTCGGGPSKTCGGAPPKTCGGAAAAQCAR